MGRNVDNFTCSLCLEAVRRAICSDLQYAKSIYFGIEAAFFICLKNFLACLKRKVSDSVESDPPVDLNI